MAGKPRIHVIKLNRKILLLIGFLLIIIIGIAIFRNQRVTRIFSYKLNQTIVLDPGHGGIDGGTGNPKDILEKDINLDIGIKLKKELIVEGFNVVMTRERDESLEHLSSINSSRYRRDLDARRNIINSNEPLIYISIHVNSSKSSSARGAKIYHFPGSEDGKELAEKIAHSIDLYLYDQYLKDDTIRAEVLSEDFFILRETEYTGVLLEVGFITNLEENRLLKDDEYKRKMAYAIKKGILEYLN
ncbi:N-acetylmuramoyl-L-alanine amidase family protein [Tepidimicrobium xylanilyticum]|uniref:N-acetylmuramoyl-L-alanine amidase n=1 Tax=Tepidimicrobium xylanilyticum TaxID=1123352 RepID=A0A1H2WQY8_9FIRM|nr:N-acetylmuramoyl-L-alanine amidase [Tepidimicrobium xylanilyticum]GMG95181.1 N-acetylmuramoyl-L-alanine amidase CwlD [Tepidimicrobium xylanilyticum]SDW82674.1 N-acetylmuramoyl-L-alanine amidase [Tepidimicrobium xylanilyticum]